MKQKTQAAIIRRANQLAFAADLVDEVLFYSLAIMMVLVAAFAAFIAADLLVAVWDMGHPGIGFVSMAHAPFLTAGWTDFFCTIFVGTVVLAGLRIYIQKL